MFEADQVIRYTHVHGRSVAWSAVGTGPPLLVGGWWCSNLEVDWRSVSFRRYISHLAENRTVIRYDRAGAGLSGRPTEALPVDGEIETIDGVLAAVGAESAELFGSALGGMLFSAYAAERPQRVQRLVVYGGFAEGRMLGSPEAIDAMLAVVSRHWGVGSRMLADILLPDGTADEREAFARLQRRVLPKATAVSALRSVYESDGSHYFPRVTAPTLVVHRHEDRAVPFPLGRDVAARIPGARFLPLAGRNHLPWRGDTDSLVAAVLEFLGVRAAGGEPNSHTHELTPRERDVLRLVAEGLTDQQIAGHLILSAHTIHRHVANVRRKLGVSSRAAAAAWAAQHGLV
jgi:pimeloyl-ACP methyl ester carboxylesterase/DNA-binding CsgD family transcriptional regulator